MSEQEQENKLQAYKAIEELLNSEIAELEKVT